MYSSPKHELKNTCNLTLDVHSHPIDGVVVTRVEVPYVALIPDYNRVGKKLCEES